MSKPKRLTFLPGVQVMADDRRYEISRVLDLETVLARDVETGKIQTLRVSALQAVPDDEHIQPVEDQEANDLAAIPESAWQTARERLAAIQPLMEANPRTADIVRQRAVEVGAHMSTLYRWLSWYEDEQRLSALLPTKPDGGQGKSRISPDINAVIEATIEDYYLTSQKRTGQATFKEVQRRCRNAGLAVPHPNTVRKRINQITDKVSLRRRGHASKARDIYSPSVDPFPNADWPLAMIQIDHTPGDIILVDDMTRLPVGRPWITVAIDVFSRMVAGFYIGFDDPSAMTTGLCLSHAILPKDTWLAKYEIDAKWPIQGIMDVVHADNAKEFRGNMLQRACDEYGIDLHWRPVARPKFGGHIERLAGTLNQAIHTLPGTTFSNPTERGEYRSDKKAAMTLTELEKWLAIYVTQVYHEKLHQGIGMSPLNQFNQGIFGDDNSPGRGLPAMPTDPDRLRLDFMPYLERTVQPYGVRIDDIVYYHDVIKSWIRAPVGGKSKARRKFIIRRDPRDISTVHFYDPELNTYFPIPYRRLDAPSMSLWELRAVRRKLKEEGERAIDEDAIFAGYERLREIEAQAVKKTTKTRRQAQRRRHHEGQVQADDKKVELPSSSDDWDEEGDIRPFDDMEIG